MLLQDVDLLIDLLDFRRFLSCFDQKLRALLSQLCQFRICHFDLFGAGLSQRAGRAGSFRRVVFSLSHLSIVLGFEQLLVEAGEPFNHRVLVRVEREHLVALRVRD